LAQSRHSGPTLGMSASDLSGPSRRPVTDDWADPTIVAVRVGRLGNRGRFCSWRGNGRPFLGLLAVIRNLPRRKRCEHSLCFVLPCSFQSLVQTQNPKGQQQRSMRRGSDKLSLAKPRNMLPAKDRRSQGRPKSTLQDSKGSKGNIPAGEPSKREN